MEVLIQPLYKVIDVEPGANLLQALHDAQVPMSHSCMAGRGGTCRCRVIDGEVLDAGRAEQNPLDGRDSTVLACQSYLTEPCTIEIPAPEEVDVHPAWIVKVKVLRVEGLADDVRRVVLAPARPIQFSPGQHAQLDFGRGLARTYSMAGLAEPALTLNLVVASGGVQRGQRRGLVTEAITQDLGALGELGRVSVRIAPDGAGVGCAARQKGIDPGRIDTQASYTQLN